MFKVLLVALLPFLLFFGDRPTQVDPVSEQPARPDSGILEKMVAESGTVTLDLDLAGLSGKANASRLRSMTFDIKSDPFFTVIVFNDELRGPLPSSMGLTPKGSADLPAKLAASYDQLGLESLTWGGVTDLAVRDRESSFSFFNVEGHAYDFDPVENILRVKGARLTLTPEFAGELGRAADAGKVVGELNFEARMRVIEVNEVVEGETVSSKLPPTNMGEAGNVPGPDVIVGELSGLAQFGASGNRVGLAVGTDSCNAGTIELNWFANPNNDHPVIPQNLYRMSGGATNDERFEQVGQSHVKHAFTALQNNICGFGCVSSGTGSRLGSGCSDPYGASLNSGPNLGSRAWINPFTGFFPRNDSATPNNSHTGHSHDGTSHRILVDNVNLSSTSNPGATYYAEAQYITPHEYAWCQANPTQCNMNNNVSFRRYNVSGTAPPFSFSPVGSTQRTKPAIEAWTGSTRVQIQPAPGVDGIGTVGYKVTNPSPGVWHYEYAIYNQNLDRAIRSFSVPVGTADISNIGFHAPPQHPGWANDGTANSAGFSSQPWASMVEAPGDLTWSTETLAQNPNANAIRWGTMYNFRFDSTSAPQTATATIGFFKTGEPITVEVQAPSAGGGTPTPTNTPTATPTPSMGWEGDVSPRPNGDGLIDATDVIQLRRFATSLDVPGGGNEGQRADIAPLATNGDGIIDAGDVVQGRRFATGLDPLTPAAGPTMSSRISDSASKLVDDIYAYFFGRELRVGTVTAISGARVTVPIEITSKGGEAGISFTLEYDPSVLSPMAVVSGDAAPAGAVITVNDNEAGRLGVLIDASAGMTASSGSKQIALITFSVVPGYSGDSPLALTGTLASLGAANTRGESLSIRHFDGRVTIAPDAKSF